MQNKNHKLWARAVQLGSELFFVQESLEVALFFFRAQFFYILNLNLLRL